MHASSGDTWSRRAALGLLASGTASGLLGAPSARAQAPAQPDPWPMLAEQIFPGRTLQDGAAVVAIDAPYRAEDAAVVPITLRTLLADTDTRAVRKITLVIDANPSPLAATFTLGPDGHVDTIATRVRVEDYTNMRAVAELGDGSLYMTKRFVKAAGGCSAPALTMTADNVPLGTMHLRLFSAKEGKLPEAQLMIRHPNYSGMQMNQLTRLYIPAKFVQTLHIWQGEQLLLTAETGISISENPSIRFDYRPNGAKMFRVEAVDSTGNKFQASFPAGAAA